MKISTKVKDRIFYLYSCGYTTEEVMKKTGQTYNNCLNNRPPSLKGKQIHANHTTSIRK